MIKCADTDFFNFLQSAPLTLQNTKSFPDSSPPPVNGYLTFTTNDGSNLLIVGRGNRNSDSVNEIQIYEMEKNLSFIRSIKQINPEVLAVLTIDNVHYIASSPINIERENNVQPIISIFELSTGILKYTLTQSSTYDHFRTAFHVYKDKSGNDVFLSCNTMNIFQWDVKNQKVAKTYSFPNGLYGPTKISSYFDSSRDVTVIAYGDENFTSFMNAETGETFKSLSNDNFYSSIIKYNNVDAIMLGTDTGYMYIFDTATLTDQKYQFNFDRNDGGYVTFMNTIVNAGKTYVVACYSDSSVYVYDLVSGKEVSKFDSNKGWHWGTAAFITLSTGKQGLIQITPGSFMLFEFSFN